MSNNVNFYNPPEYYYRNAKAHLLKAVESGKVNITDKELIDEYMAEVSGNLSPGRYYKLIIMLVGNFDFHPSYLQCTLVDVQSIPNMIQNAKKPDGTTLYSKNTFADRVRMAKRIFIWLAENERITLNLRKISAIKTPAYDRYTVTADDIFTEEEIQTFLESCHTARDRAMFWIMYEGALRVGEIGNLRFRDVKITDKFCTINTSEKTGKPRYIPLVVSKPYYAQWVNEYPGVKDPDNFVFINRSRKPMTRAAIAKQMRTIAKKAGIQKDVWPHLFRHSRITHLLQAKPSLPESQIKLICWGDVNTNMLATYQHLTNNDLERSMAILNGIDIDEEEEPKKRHLKPIQCKECGHVNGPTMDLCEVCGSPLTAATRDAAELLASYLREKIMGDPQFLLAVAGSKVK